MMHDKLSKYPGLQKQPHPNSKEYDNIVSQIEFMLNDKGCDGSEEGRKEMAQHLLRFMVARGFWPLGTKCVVSKKFKVKTKFPRIPE